MGRPSNRSARRAQILDGFQSAMAKHGFEKATIQSIASEAGLTSGLIHYHFASKLEILLELVATLNERLQARFESCLADASTPAERLAAFIDSRLAQGEGADPRAVSCWVAIGTEALRQPEVGEVYRESMREQQRVLKGLLTELKVEDERLDSTAAALLAAIEGCYQLAAAVPDIAPPGFAATSVRRMAEGLLNRKLPS